MSKEFEFWFTVFFFGFFIATAITWILFARLTMARIEKDIKGGGHPESFGWDGIGGRIVFYALAIVLPARAATRIDKLIDVNLVRRYATKIDWVFGFSFLIVADIWIFISFVGIALQATGAFQ